MALGDSSRLSGAGHHGREYFEPLSLRRSPADPALLPVVFPRLVRGGDRRRRVAAVYYRLGDRSRWSTAHSQFEHEQSPSRWSAFWHTGTPMNRRVHVSLAAIESIWTGWRIIGIHCRR